ncbi:MAG TPA: hypothetical protein VLG76_06105 [Rhabdochlamydiaceae bacterium]|nr:hypothetical protein [Rhabdochlamydiaceae bacterium]
MKFFYYLLIWNITSQALLYSSNAKILGDDQSKHAWVYLCGLKEDLDSESTQNEISILNDIGQNLHIKIIAIDPPKRCRFFDNKLCWPYENQTKLQQTYAYIASIVNKEQISGYLGFSNGGFFLLELAKSIPLGSPIITIGAGGNLSNPTAKNRIILLIGKYDSYHYNSAHQFYKQSNNTPLVTELIECEHGHCIPKTLLYEVIKRTQTSTH